MFIKIVYWDDKYGHSASLWEGNRAYISSDDEPGWNLTIERDLGSESIRITEDQNCSVYVLNNNGRTIDTLLDHTRNERVPAQPR